MGLLLNFKLELSILSIEDQQIKCLKNKLLLGLAKAYPFTFKKEFTRITENQQVRCIHYDFLKSPCFPHWHCIFVAF